MNLLKQDEKLGRFTSSLYTGLPYRPYF